MGGFAPANPRHVIEIQGDDEDKASIRVSKLISKHDYEVHEGVLQSSDIRGILSDVQSLRSLPTEEPPSSQDIYGLDTAISVETKDFSWRNGGPEGCVHGESQVSANAEHKTQFKKVADKLAAAGSKFATKKADA